MLKEETKKLSLTLSIIWIAIIIYLVLYYNVTEVRNAIEAVKNDLAIWASSSENVVWMFTISFFISFLGSASIGIPIPFALVLFGFGKSIYDGFFLELQSMNLVFQNAEFWGLMIGCIVLGGIGAASGESSTWFVGRGIKAVTDRRKLKKEKIDGLEEEAEKGGIMHNMDGFGKLLSRNPNWVPMIVFLFALTPLPDDILFLPLGMIGFSFWKVIIPGAFGKAFTIALYMFYPILIGSAAESLGGDVILESVILGLTATIILGLMMYDWNLLLPKIEAYEQRKLQKKMQKTK